MLNTITVTLEYIYSELHGYIYKYTVETEIMISARLNILREGFSHFLFYDLIVCVKSLRDKRSLNLSCSKYYFYMYKKRNIWKLQKKYIFYAESQYFLCEKVQRNSKHQINQWGVLIDIIIKAIIWLGSKLSLWDRCWHHVLTTIWEWNVLWYTCILISVI